MTARRLISALILLLAAAGGASAAGLPVALQDPNSGYEVELKAGAPALHLVFFATWCPPCVKELGRLAELEARKGAPNLDSACTGTTIRDYLRGSDLTPVPEDVIALYEDQPPQPDELSPQLSASGS